MVMAFWFDIEIRRSENRNCSTGINESGKYYVIYVYSFVVLIATSISVGSANIDFGWMNVNVTITNILGNCNLCWVWFTEFRFSFVQNDWNREIRSLVKTMMFRRNTFVLFCFFFRLNWRPHMISITHSGLRHIWRCAQFEKLNRSK